MPIIPSSNIQALHLGETRRHPLPGPVLSTCQSGNTRGSGRRSFPAPTLSQTASPTKCKLPEREPEIDARFRPLFSVPPPALKCLLGTKGREQRTITSVFPTSGDNADLGRSSRQHWAQMQPRSCGSNCHLIISPRLSPNQRLLACWLYSHPGSHRRSPCSPRVRPAALLAFCLCPWAGPTF